MSVGHTGNRQFTKRKGLLLGGIFLMIGLLISSVGGFSFWNTQGLIKDGLRSPGKVIELLKPPSAKYYLPVVQFETADHQIIIAVCKTGSNPPAHKVADAVTVIYRAASPEYFCLDDPFDLWFLAYLFGGIGLIFAMVGSGLLLLAMRRA